MVTSNAERVHLLKGVKGGEGEHRSERESRGLGKAGGLSYHVVDAILGQPFPFVYKLSLRSRIFLEHRDC